MTYGIYGKLPCTGDFVRRDLPQPFVGAWDHWLQTLLVMGKNTLGTRWNDCYLQAPIWRFALSPGVCGPNGAAGVVMPSVDRVGRQFPLCIATKSDRPAWANNMVLQPVTAALENAALDTLEPDASLHQLEATLASLPAPAEIQVPASAPFACTVKSIWTASIGGCDRVLLLDDMPTGGAHASALFDPNDPQWTSL